MAKTAQDWLFETKALVQEGVLDAHPLFMSCPIDELLRICNGCGAAGRIDLVPDTIYGLPVRPACILHDFEYNMGKSLPDKTKADRRFLINMIALINRGNRFLRIPRRYRAMSYYGAVCDFGHDAFWAGKEQKHDDTAL